MTPDQTALAKRLVAHPKWQWVHGMRVYEAGRIVYEDRRDGAIYYDGSIDTEPGGLYLFDVSKEDVPDLSDYATAAILLRMAMEDGMLVAWRTERGLHGAETSWPPSRDLPDLGTAAATALLAAWGDDARGEKP